MGVYGDYMALTCGYAVVSPDYGLDYVTTSRGRAEHEMPADGRHLRAARNRADYMVDESTI